MNFFKDRDLAHRLHNHQVSSKEKLFYLLIFMLFIHLNLSISTYSQETNYIKDLILVVMEIVGLIICYQTNRKGDDKEFIERYICLFFPIFVQTFLVTIIFFIFGFLINILLRDKYQIIEYMILIVSVVYFYIRMRKSIEIAASDLDSLITMSKNTEEGVTSIPQK